MQDISRYLKFKTQYLQFLKEQMWEPNDDIIDTFFVLEMACFAAAYSYCISSQNVQSKYRLNIKSKHQGGHHFQAIFLDFFGRALNAKMCIPPLQIKRRDGTSIISGAKILCRKPTVSFCLFISKLEYKFVQQSLVENLPFTKWMVLGFKLVTTLIRVSYHSP